jgi:hypothetical protein
MRTPTRRLRGPDDLNSAREAVELLGNEAVWYLREVVKEGVYGKVLADQITQRYLATLRLLFLFYVEAREELTRP